MSIKIIPPVLESFQAIINKKIKTKLGIKCINNANSVSMGVYPSEKTSKANILIKAINKIVSSLGIAGRYFFFIEFNYIISLESGVIY